MNKNKGIISIGLILAIILGMVVVGGGAYYLGKSGSKQEIKNPVNNQEINQNENLPVVDNNQQAKCDSNSAPWIKVVSPNGGEVYKIGDKMTIKWDSCNIKNGVGFEQIRVIHSPHDADNTNTYINPSNINIKDKVLTWNIPSNIDVTKKYVIYLETGMWTQGNNEYSPSDESDNSFTINSGINTINLSTFSSQYIAPNYPPNPWPPIVQHNTTAYSCSTISRDVFDSPTTLKGTQKNINGRTFCKYSFSDGGAGSYSGIYTYITAESNGSGTERVDFRSSWHSCGAYDESQYYQCENDQSTFFNNLDAYIASLM